MEKVKLVLIDFQKDMSKLLGIRLDITHVIFLQQDCTYFIYPLSLSKGLSLKVM